MHFGYQSLQLPVRVVGRVMLLLLGTVVATLLSDTVRAQRAIDPEARLQAVVDYVEIEKVLMRYAAALNTYDADTYVSLFTPDAVFELKRNVDEPPFLGPFVGRDAIRKQWFPNDGARSRADIGRKFGPMRHVTTNYEIDVTGDTATVRAFFMEVVSNGANSPPGGNPPTIHAMGRYEDELVRHDGRWLFSKRTVITDLNTRWEPEP
jgi:ketosteroid isomerase-like protein